MTKKQLAAFVLGLLSLCLSHLPANGDQELPVSGYLSGDLAGKSGKLASQSVFRVICGDKNRVGTGFLHKSGSVLTADHVVRDCDPKSIQVHVPRGTKCQVEKVVGDKSLDIAILTLESKLNIPALTLRPSVSDFTFGTQVSMWGYPAGYNGQQPLLTVGHLSGFESRGNVPVWVLNAAINSGNSGSPVIGLDDGTVIGVAVSKLAPIPQKIEADLEWLSKQEAGLVTTRRYSDGTEEKVSQSKIIAEVLQYLRSQTQLVIGHAVMTNMVRAFLKENGIEP